MIVSIERSGGVAGVRSARRIDTATLEPDRRMRAEAALSRLLLEPGEPLGRTSAQPDRFTYRLTVLMPDGEEQLTSAREDDPAWEEFSRALE